MPIMWYTTLCEGELCLSYKQAETKVFIVLQIHPDIPLHEYQSTNFMPLTSQKSENQNFIQMAKMIALIGKRLVSALF